MEKQEEGIVIAVEGNIAKVKVKRHSHCESCGSCPGTNAMVLDALNNIGAQVSQRVQYQILGKNMLLAAFVVFILPLIITLAGYWLANELASTYQIVAYWPGIIGSASGFALGVWLVRYYDKLARSKSMIPVITRIIDE
jgi:sigma-E factor negative regulatory protein RseC